MKSFFILQGKRAQNLIPCTIAQILKSQAVDDGFRCGEVDLHQVGTDFILDSVLFFFSVVTALPFVDFEFPLY